MDVDDSRKSARVREATAKAVLASEAKKSMPAPKAVRPHEEVKASLQGVSKFDKVLREESATAVPAGQKAKT